MEFEEEYAIKPRKWLLIILIVLAIGITTFLVSSSVIKIKERVEREAANIKEQELKDTIEKQKKELNGSLKMYSGEQYGSFAVKILDKISTNNQTNQLHKVTVVFGSKTTDNPEEINALKKLFDDNSKYGVSLYYDDDGYVNKVIIQLTKKDTFKVQSYNFKFETYSGTQIGIQLCNMLDDVITNNKTNKDHLLTVKYKNTTTTNPDKIKNLKKSFDDWTKYEVSLDYDTDGYVNKIIIE